MDLRILAVKKNLNRILVILLKMPLDFLIGISNLLLERHIWDLVNSQVSVMEHFNQMIND